MSRRAHREVDVIDVNRTWSVYVGSRRYARGLGTVQAASHILALRAAIAKWPDIRIGIFVEEDEIMRCSTLRRQFASRAAGARP